MIIYSDSPFSDTGFACVVRNIVDRYKREEDPIRVFGVNHHETETQYNAHTSVVPAMDIREALKEKPDPYGYKRFARFLELEKEPSVVLTILDPQVATNVLDALRVFQARGGYWIAYWPIDSHVVSVLKEIISAPDEVVFYTKYGRDESLKLFKSPIEGTSRMIEKISENKIAHASIIPHGVDSNVFRVPTAEERREARALVIENPVFGCDAKTQIFVSVNRNQPRKNYAQLIRAFARYQREENANSRLFLHCAKVDTLGDIEDMAIVYGLKYGRDVILPSQSEPTLPANKMHLPYWTGDAFVTTTLGEGWGLTISEAAACGLPVVAPRNSCIDEVLEPYGMQFMYKAQIPTIIGSWDMYRTRYTGHDEDIVESMHDAMMFSGHHEKAAKQYAEHFSWDKIVREQWAPLFDAAFSIVKARR